MGVVTVTVIVTISVTKVSFILIVTVKVNVIETVTDTMTYSDSNIDGHFYNHYESQCDSYCYWHSDTITGLVSLFYIIYLLSQINFVYCMVLYNTLLRILVFLDQNMFSIHFSILPINL